MSDSTSTAGTGDDVVLVLVDHVEGAVRGPVLELLTAARGLGPVEAVWLGPEPVPAALAVLGEHGARVVHHVTTEPVQPEGAPEASAASVASVALQEHLPVVVAAAVEAVVHEVGARTVLVPSTFAGKEAAARLAWSLGAALMVDAAAVERTPDGRVLTGQQAFAASWSLRSEATTPVAVVALKANAVAAEAVEGSAPATVRTHAVVERPDLGGVRVLERTVRPPSGRPALSEAQVVVVGGRGTNGDFGAVEELADVLGGAVGATRVATDEGWIGHEAQIGQTGVTVSPRLYIGAGVSGAVHHRGGMQSSGTVVAVNEDPEAPIFEIADYGVVGDLTTVLPQAAAELRRLLG